MCPRSGTIILFLLFNMAKQNRALLVEGKIGKTLFYMSLPMIVGIIGMVLFNLVDTYFVGRLGADELAAISFTFPVIFLIGSITMGLGIGTSSVISRAIGEGNNYKVQRLTTDSIILSIILSAIFLLAGLLTIRPLFRLMGATSEVLPLIEEYMSIWYLGMPFVIIPMVGNNAIRATGDTKTPALIMFTAIVVNITLDPLLIFGPGPFPRLELKGAAIATVIARAVTMIVAFYVLYRRDKMVTFAKPEIKDVMGSWKKILYIGLPAAGTNLIIPLSIGIITRLISQYGKNAVAAFGVGSKVEMFAMAVIMALSSVLAPFVGQNWGAEKIGRINRGIRISQFFSLIWGVALFFLFLFMSDRIAGIFNDNVEIVNLTSLYLIILSVSYGFQGVLRLSGSALNALNKPLPSAALSILQMFVLYIPLALIGSKMTGIKGIFAAGAIANIAAGSAAFLLLRRFTTSNGAGDRGADVISEADIFGRKSDDLL